MTETSTSGGEVTWRELLSGAEDSLREAGVEDPRTEARRLLAEASGLEPHELILQSGSPAGARAVHRLDEMVGRRVGGEPLQYVLGCWSFRRLDLFMDERVLIPRPETEVVVEVALGELDRVSADPCAPKVAADLGTGSGAIALSLAVERENVEVWATDASAAALAVARANLAGAGRAAGRVRLAEGSWFEALPRELAGAFDLIVANPPYVSESEVLPGAVSEWEPRSALVAGPTGTEDLEHIVAGAPEWLHGSGALVVELAPHQAEPLKAFAGSSGYAEVDVFEDLSGRRRGLICRRSAAPTLGASMS